MAANRSPRWALIVAISLALAVAAGLRLARLPDLPLGLHYDEAANGILAGQIAQGIKRPVFIPSYTGKEVLFFYWAAAWMRAMGEGVLALRLTSAVVGLCTVGAAAWGAYELLHDRKDAAWIGVLTAAFLATSFWHLILSRCGFRAVTQPLLQALTVGALWRGLRLERRGWVALAGLLAGATLYTYLAARAFPIPLAAALLALVAADRGRRRARLGQVVVFAAAALVAVAPLAAYFVAHPAALTTRMSQVAARSWAEAWQGFRACLGMFFIKGDPYIRFNLPGRPLFDPIMAALFLLGIPLVFVARRPKPEVVSRLSPLPSRVFLLTVLPVMLLPSALATGEITPSNLRAVGLLPFVYIFPALAIGSILQIADSRLQITDPGSPSRISDRGFAIWGLGSVILLLATLAPITATTYLGWAASPGLYEAADGDLVDVAAYLNGTDLADVTPYVASIHYRHPTLAFLADGYPAVKWLTGGETLVLPAEEEGLLVLPRSADDGRTWMEERLPALSLLATPPGPDGQPAFYVYRVPAGATAAPSHPITANFGYAVTFLGYDLLGISRSGESADVVIYWRVEARPEPGDLRPLIRLSDPWGGIWGEAFPFHYPAEQWAPGEVVMDHLSVPVAAGAPPGAYRLQVGFYAASTGTNLPVLGPSGDYAGVAVELPLVLEQAAAPPDPADLPIRRRLDLATEAGLTLLGANLDTETARPGEPVYLTLFWRADRAPLADLTVRLRLGEETLYKGSPVHSTYPARLWAVGEVVVDRYDPRLDRKAEAGTYSLSLALLDAEGHMLLGPLSLGGITIEAMERVFEPPPLAHPVSIPLGGEVELIGYDLEPEPVTPGGRVTLTLYWRALMEMETSYTVFVHLLGPDGETAAQHDGVPAAGSYPTTLWVTGEVVTDPHVLVLPADLPPGTHTLEVGMYVVETGQRLSVSGSGENAARFQVLIQP
ncbi:MAG TPA: hypothetical protein ENI39_01840 [Anaerolineae bacterium]|nr:hypothetical protein [Anaerolineae bacterium]